MQSSQGSSQVAVKDSLIGDIYSTMAIQQSIERVMVQEEVKKKNDPNLAELVDFGKLEIRKYINTELEQVDEDL